MAFRLDRQLEQHKKAVNWLLEHIVYWGAGCFFFSILTLPLAFMIDSGFSEESFARSLTFLKSITTNPENLVFRHIDWLIAFVKADNRSFGLWMPWLPLPLFIWGVSWFGLWKNPWEFGEKPFGDACWAEDYHIKKIMKLDQGKYYILGDWNGTYLRLKEPQSVFCIGAPGVGKTAGVVIPSILETDEASMVIHDPKGEIFKATAGYRASLGPVFLLDWSAEDQPEKGFFYPRWNPLAPHIMPPPGPRRDLYIDNITAVLVEESISGSDMHWIKAGRNVLSGMIHFIVSKCERAQANDYFLEKLQNGALSRDDEKALIQYYKRMEAPGAEAAITFVESGILDIDTYLPVGTWRHMPARWIGHEPNLAMLVDWLNESQIEISKELKLRMAEGDMTLRSIDTMRRILETTVMEIRYYGYPQRALQEFLQLLNTPSKERGSIISMAVSGISIFKNEAVKQRTSASDFVFSDLRGIKDPKTGKFQPVTIYLSVPHTDSRALAPLTAVFIEMMSAYLLASVPGAKTKHGRNGPYPVIFVLDELPYMPKMRSVIEGPALGRTQGVAFLFVCQDMHQISGTFGEEDLETILGTTRVKISLRVGSEKMNERLTKFTANKTFRHQDSSKDEGLSAAFTMAKNVSESVYAASSSDWMFIYLADFMCLVMYHAEYPIMCPNPRYFATPGMKEKSEMTAPPALPEWIRQKSKERAEKETRLADLRIG